MRMDPDLEAAPPLLPPPKTWVDRIQALFEVLLLAGLVSSLLAALPFLFTASGRQVLQTSVVVLCAYLLLETAISLILLYLIMRAHGETLGWLGLSWTRMRSGVLLGLAIVPLLFGLNILVSGFFTVFFPTHVLEHNPLIELVHTPRDLVLFVATATVSGGIKEELQRAFILRRFQAYLGGPLLGLILWSIVFGLGHYVQGAQGMVAAGVLGLFFGIAYLARGNLVIPMVAHGLYDSITLIGFFVMASK